MFNQSMRIILLGFALWFCLWLSVGQNQVIATVLSETKPISLESIQTFSELPTLESEIDRFLTSIPPGYYTIATVEGLKSLLKTRQPLLIDVREVSEYRLGHISNAINIPLRTLARNLDQVPRDRPVVLYCSTGYRSAMGVMTLHLLGYDNIQGFPPSFAGWKASEASIAILQSGQMEY